MERRHIGDSDFGLWEVKLGVLIEFMVVPLPSIRILRLAHYLELYMSSS